MTSWINRMIQIQYNTANTGLCEQKKKKKKKKNLFVKFYKK